MARTKKNRSKKIEEEKPASVEAAGDDDTDMQTETPAAADPTPDPAAGADDEPSAKKRRGADGKAVTPRITDQLPKFEVERKSITVTAQAADRLDLRHVATQLHITTYTGRPHEPLLVPMSAISTRASRKTNRLRAKANKEAAAMREKDGASDAMVDKDEDSDDDSAIDNDDDGDVKVQVGNNDESATHKETALATSGFAVVHAHGLVEIESEAVESEIALWVELFRLVKTLRRYHGLETEIPRRPFKAAPRTDGTKPHHKPWLTVDTQRLLNMRPVLRQTVAVVTGLSIHKGFLRKQLCSDGRHPISENTDADITTWHLGEPNIVVHVDKDGRLVLCDLQHAVSNIRTPRAPEHAMKVCEAFGVAMKKLVPLLLGCSPEKAAAARAARKNKAVESGLKTAPKEPAKTPTKSKKRKASSLKKDADGDAKMVAV